MALFQSKLLQKRRQNIQLIFLTEKFSTGRDLSTLSGINADVNSTLYVTTESTFRTDIEFRRFLYISFYAIKLSNKINKKSLYDIINIVTEPGCKSPGKICTVIHEYEYEKMRQYLWEIKQFTPDLHNVEVRML